MPAPTLNFVPRGPGWPAARGGARGQAGMAGLGEWLDMAQTQGVPPGTDNSGLLTMSQMAPGAVGPWDPNLATYGMSGMGSFPNMVWPGMSGMGEAPAVAPQQRGMLPMLSPGVKLVLAAAFGAGVCYWWCKGKSKKN